MRSLRVLSLLLLGCASGVPDDVLFLLGAAPAGVELVLERRLSDLCFVPSALDLQAEPFEELGRTFADAAGRYTFELYRAQTSPGGDTRACFQVTLAGHAGAAARTQFYGADVHLPELRPWDTRPTFGEGVWRLGALPTLPDGSLNSAGIYEWQLDATGAPLWRADATSPLSLPTWLLEDFAAVSLRAVAHGTYLHYDDSLGALFASYTEGSLWLQSDAVSLDSAGGGPPPSREASCWLDEEEVAACPLNDGALDRVSLAEGRGYRQLELRWSEPRVLQALALRGLEVSAQTVVVEVSEGGEGWRTVAEHSEPWGDVESGRTRILRTPGRWVLLDLGGSRGDRVRLTSGQGHFYAVREVSVFE